MARSTKRTFDVIVFGATGFTGELVAEYLAETYPSKKSLKWAIAGRNLSKLESVRARLAKRWPHAADLQLVEAESNNLDSLRAMAKKTKVVCTTVGPYAKYGGPLVKACASEGTDYCDLTGETQFIRQMVDSHQELAVESGAKIVHCCGFDSIPSDLGTLVLQEHALEVYGRAAQQVRLYVWRTKGGASGGTIASVKNIVDEAKTDAAVRKILADPYALNPPGQRKGPDGGDQNMPKYDKTIRSWTAPFVMAAINTRVVRRSNALLNYRYGKEFRYGEVMRTGEGLKGRAMATAVSAGMGGLVAGLAFGPTRSLLDKWLPDAGEGPSREAIENGFFDIRLIGKVRGADVRVTVKADRDPGYGATATMLGQAAVCLAKDRRKLPKGGGILTPASSMGMVLVDRLREAGMTFEVM